LRSSVRQVVVNAAIGSLPLSLRRHLLYTRFHGRLGNFRTPRSFTEKINWRILHDRRDLMSWTCDKLQMKDYAADFGVRTPTTLWVGDSVAELADLSLPDRWVLKANNSSQTVFLGRGRPDVAHLHEVTDPWRRSVQGRVFGEWAYSQARACLFVEEWIGSSEAPPDYKFFVFDGQVACVQVDTGRFTTHRRSYFDTAWETLDVTCTYPPVEQSAPPERFEELMSVASRLGEAFDFMRVDLFATDNGVYLGELTPYPGGGVEPFSPVSFDDWLGNEWTLPRLGA
jgi:hypothetical protein